MRDGFYSGAIRSPIKWSAPFGSASYARKHGRILPMEHDEPKRWWRKG